MINDSLYGIKMTESMRKIGETILLLQEGLSMTFAQIRKIQ
ncbi:MAG: hypothetical protein ACJZ7A_01800 [Opitutales bacterium]